MSDYKNKKAYKKAVKKRRARDNKMKRRRANIREEARLKREVEKIQFQNRTKLKPFRKEKDEEEGVENKE